MSVVNSTIPDSVSVGDFTCIGKNTTIGENTRISSHCNIYGAKIGSDCMIGSMCEIQRGSVIGNGTRIQSHSFICSSTRIGNNCFLAHGIMTINDTFGNRKVNYSSGDWEELVIKDNVIIGSGAILFPVIIGVNSIIGAGSVVTKSIPPDCIAWGNPCEVKYFLKDKKE